MNAAHFKLAKQFMFNDIEREVELGRVAGLGRKPLITAGMLLQAGALGLLVAGGGAFTPSLIAAILLGAGTAMVYPTLIAAVSDVTQPRDRARVVGVYRFWRDFGFVLGALIAGNAASMFQPRKAGESQVSAQARKTASVLAP